MSDYIDIRFLGDKDLQRKLKRLEIKTQRAIVRPSMKKSMVQVKDKAQELAPVKTGKLRDSIKQGRQRTRRGITRASVVTGTRQELGIAPDARGFYPAAHEYGSKNQPARSYLRRALSELKGQVLGQLADLIGKGIEREAKKR
ncbi:MAG: HK97 gp10 family phage protein [Pontiella sp.]|nr:HK97 gp10 family phage protein [Pontiella sp.]